MNEGERYRDLAERVLGRTATGSEVSLTLDDLAPEAAGRIHLPAGTRVIGSVVRRPMGEVLSIAVNLASPLDAKAFGEAVRVLYGAQGYRQAPAHPGMTGGFRPSFGGLGGLVLCQGDDGPWMSASVRASAAGSEGAIVWNGPAAGPGPCAPRPYGPGMPDVLPPLEAPDGVELLLGGGFGGGGASWTSSGIAYTQLNARDLVGAFAPQLDAAGATSLGSGGDQVVGWGQWKLLKEPWQATLIAFGRDERKDLQLRVEREDFRKRDEATRRSGGWRTFGF